MAETPIPPAPDDRGYIRTRSNILVPPDYGIAAAGMVGRDDGPGPILSMLLEQKRWYGASLDHQAFQPGHHVRRNDDYGFLQLPPKGSGLDDLLSAAIVDGTIGNIGISPVVSAQLSAILNRQISQARTAEVTLNGRASPVKRAKEAIAWYDDSPLGFNSAVSKIVYQMRSFNRGAPHATIPITFRVADWAGYGLEAIPLDAERNLYYLAVDWAIMGTPVPFLPDPLALEATGDREWPYWLRKKLSDNDKDYAWILLHQTQIIPMIPGESRRAGVGTCSVYMFWEILCDLALEKVRRAEKMIHEPTHGLLTIDGITQNAKEIKSSINEERIVRDSQGRKVDKGLTVITGKDAIHAAFLSFRESYADFVEFKQAVEDVLAQVFGEPLSAIATRKGVGYSAQTSANVQGSADAGVTTILSDISMVLGAIYRRVKVSVYRPNDESKVRTMENLNTFAQAIGNLPEGTLSDQEVRALIHTMIVEIPQTGDSSTQSANPNEDQGDNNDPNSGDDSGDGSTSSPTGDGSTSSPTGDTDQEENSALMAEVAKLAPIKPEGTAKGRKPQAGAALKDQHWHDRWDLDFPELDGLTQAKKKEKKDEDDLVWLWNSDDLVYTRGDQTVDRDATLDLREDLRLLRQADADDLAQRLANDEITLQQWLDGIQDAVEGVYITQGMLGGGGADQVNRVATTWLDDILETPFTELDDLAKRIAEGLYSEAQIANYTRGTINGSAQGYEGLNAVAHGARNPRNLPAFPGDGSSECNGACHCFWSFRRAANGDLLATWRHPPFGRRIPGVEPCRTCERRIREWIDLVVDGATIYSPPLRKVVGQLTAEGLSPARIAKRLNVTEQSVRNAQYKLRKRGLLGYIRKPRDRSLSLSKGI